jgi:putative hydrolase of the HAD superfamily
VKVPPTSTPRIAIVRKTDTVAIRGLLFDFDGLLIDTETPARLAYEELYREHGHELPLDKWATLVGTIGAEFDPNTHLEELVGRPLDQVALAERRRAREFELCDLEDFRPGIEDYLAAADGRGLKTAIVSSSNTDWIERHLERLDRVDGWDLIVAANGDVARAKPQPDLYVEALRTLGLRPPEGIAFEDSVNGIRAAKGAGLFVVAVPNPITATFAFDEADLVLDSLEDLSLDELIDRVAVDSS